MFYRASIYEILRPFSSSTTVTPAPAPLRLTRGNCKTTRLINVLLIQSGSPPSQRCRRHSTSNASDASGSEQREAKEHQAEVGRLVEEVQAAGGGLSIARCYFSSRGYKYFFIHTRYSPLTCYNALLRQYFPSGTGRRRRRTFTCNESGAGGSFRGARQSQRLVW